MKCVVFELLNHQYALDIKYVNEITGFRTIQMIPNASEYILGAIDLRNKVIPIIGLNMLFGLEKHFSDDQKIVIGYGNEKHVGFLIDRSCDVRSFDESKIKQVDPLLGGKAPLMKGLYDDENEKIYILSFDAILQNCQGLI